MFEPFVIKEDNKNKAIRNPVLNSFCCGSLYSFLQVHHLLPVLGTGSLASSWGLGVVSSALPAGRPTLSERRNPRSKQAQHTA